MSKWMRGLHYFPKICLKGGGYANPRDQGLNRKSCDTYITMQVKKNVFFLKLPEMTTQNRKLWVKCMHDRLQIRPAAALCSSFACARVITQKCGKRGSQTSQAIFRLWSPLCIVLIQPPLLTSKHAACLTSSTFPLSLNKVSD